MIRLRQWRRFYQMIFHTPSLGNLTIFPVAKCKPLFTNFRNKKGASAETPRIADLTGFCNTFTMCIILDHIRFVKIMRNQD